MEHQKERSNRSQTLPQEPIRAVKGMPDLILSFLRFKMLCRTSQPAVTAITIYSEVMGVTAGSLELL
jgi:hypothetical protein